MRGRADDSFARVSGKGQGETCNGRTRLIVWTDTAAVFGGNHGRLTANKKKYDPDNIFRRNSNLQPYADE